MKIYWNKCSGDTWCELYTVDLNDQHFSNMDGVYVIWHGGGAPNCVFVGQGIIRERLAEHRTDPAVQQYAGQELFVTWSRVAPADRSGVERYLAEELSPKVGYRFPDVGPIAVNLPGLELAIA